MDGEGRTFYPDLPPGDQSLYQDQFEPIAELDGARAVVVRFFYGCRSNVPDLILKDDRTYPKAYPKVYHRIFKRVFMSRRRIGFFLAFGSLAATSTLILTCYPKNNPVIDSLQTLHPGIGEGLYEELSAWEAALGKPRTVTQADGAQTYFYWPDAGIAVFTHPHYQGQYTRKPPSARKVTSVILAMQPVIHPSVPPVDDSLRISFERLAPVLLNGQSITEMNAEELASHLGGKIKTSETSLEIKIGCPRVFPQSTIRLHLENGRVNELEIREDWLFSHYD